MILFIVICFYLGLNWVCVWEWMSFWFVARTSLYSRRFRCNFRRRVTFWCIVCCLLVWLLVYCLFVVNLICSVVWNLLMCVVVFWWVFALVVSITARFRSGRLLRRVCWVMFLIVFFCVVCFVMWINFVFYLCLFCMCMLLLCWVLLRWI